jgi:hypothetical protein
LQIIAHVLGSAVVRIASLTDVVVPGDLVLRANIKCGDRLTDGSVSLDEGVEETVFRRVTPLASVGEALGCVVRYSRAFVVVVHTAVGVWVAAEYPRA